MGSGTTPFFAYLFLYYYGSKYMNSFKKNLWKLRTFAICLLIWSRNVINDVQEFGNSFRDTNPGELQLHKEDSVNLEASVLDLQIKIDNRKFILCLSDIFFPLVSLERHANTLIFHLIVCWSACLKWRERERERENFHKERFHISFSHYFSASFAFYLLVSDT